MLRTVGLLSPGAENLVPYAIKLYAKNTARNISEDEDKKYWETRGEFGRKFGNPEFVRFARNVTFLGLWDTVKSVGWLNARAKFEQARWPFTRNVKNVATARLALAIDENRRPFPPYRFDAQQVAERPERPQGGVVRGSAQRRRRPVRRPPALGHRARLDGRRGDGRRVEGRREASTRSWWACRPAPHCPRRNAVDGVIHRHRWIWALAGGWKARALTTADVLHPSVQQRIDGTAELGEAVPAQGGAVAMPDTVSFSESPDSPRSHIGLRIIAQDPTVTGDNGKILTATVKVPWSRMEDGPCGARFHVVDFDASTGNYLKHPGLPNEDAYADADDKVLETDFTFHAQQVYAAASRTLATFESALGRRLSWGFHGHHLHLVPHAFAEANAYYSFEDRALLFGYVPGAGDGATYTCLSYDVVVHETAHAVLDGLRGRFLEPGLPDQAAFHEGFADIVALLSVFSMRPVVEQALGKAGKDGRIKRRQVERDALRRGVLTGVAEQLGKVLTQGRGALRRSAMEPPPADWADLPQFQEPHRRGEVLVAIVLDVLLDIWVKRLEPLVSPGSRGRGGHARPGARCRGGSTRRLAAAHHDDPRPGLPAAGRVRVRRPARRRAARRRRGGAGRRPRIPSDAGRPVRAGRRTAPA